ncbi:hypothetical protein LCL87_10145 [Rhodococcus hoagii]|nr:hypothetical protein [Prescottella equi]
MVISRFLASGARHIAGSSAVLSCPAPGARLQLCAEPENPVNERAELIRESTGESVAYVLDWLLDDLETLLARANTFEIVAEGITPDAHPHMRAALPYRGSPRSLTDTRTATATRYPRLSMVNAMLPEWRSMTRKADG